MTWDEGKIVNIDIEQLTIQHIAHGLSQVNRFCGQTRYPYSVAQHSIILADWMFKNVSGLSNCRYALLHDCVEAMGVADSHGRLKKLLCPEIRVFESIVTARVWEKLGGWRVRQDYDYSSFTKPIDQRLGNAEAWAFGFPHSDTKQAEEDSKRLGYRLTDKVYWNPRAVRDKFLTDWQMYGGSI